MNLSEKSRLLRKIPLFSRVPKAKLAALAKFLEPLLFEDGGVIFEEGSPGDSLLFVSTGNVRIQKKADLEGRPSFKDLAILGPGDCFGEMTLFEKKPKRSARAAAQGKVVLFQLSQVQTSRWLKANPSLAVGFFTELAQVLVRRLRRTSNEQILLFDLSQWLLEPIKDGKELLQKTLRHLVPHLEGDWSAGAFLFNDFNDEMDLVATEGSFSGGKESAKTDDPLGIQDGWREDKIYTVTLPGPRPPAPRGRLVFQHATPLSGEEKNEISRTLTTASRLITAALEGVQRRSEEEMRTRLANTRQNYATGI